jgi:SHS2 domain-containing protein
MTYRYLEHTADIGVEVAAPTLPEAFSEAGVALFGIMTDISGFEEKSSAEFSCSGEDLISLLYSWLEELIYIFDTSGMVMVRIQVEQFSEDPPSIAAVGWGEEFDPSRHQPRTGVKAITYHRMEARKEGNQHVLRYFVDI